MAWEFLFLGFRGTGAEFREFGTRLESKSQETPDIADWSTTFFDSGIS